MERQATIMKRILGEMEQKVVKIFTGDNTDQVEAVLYKEVDSIGSTLGYILHYILSGEKISHSSADALIDRFHNS